MTRIIFLRHFETAVDPDAPAADWELSDSGRAAMRDMLAADWPDTVDQVFSSPEPKALQTAQAVADSRDIPVTAIDALAEVDRSGEGFIEDHDEYVAMVQQYLTAPTTPFNWEDREQVEDRIRTFLNQLPGDGTVLAVTHGMFLATLLPPVRGTDRFKFWQDLGFGERITVTSDALQEVFDDATARPD